jgi:hypothetical protein
MTDTQTTTDQTESFKSLLDCLNEYAQQFVGLTPEQALAKEPRAYFFVLVTKDGVRFDNYLESDKELFPETEDEQDHPIVAGLNYDTLDNCVFLDIEEGVIIKASPLSENKDDEIEDEIEGESASV